MVNYPGDYKFFSMELEIKPSLDLTHRTTYDLVLLFSELGGILSFLIIVS
jgi:hypothetical protein